MSYQVIARKWRPQTFAEVTGQEHVTRTLTNALEHSRLHHAYIFTGVRGVGKTTTARLLAKAVNCGRLERPNPEPCRNNDPDACISCREVTAGASVDVVELDAASNTGVDNVREAIIQSVSVRPSRDRYRVFIIDEVHMLSAAAFNALLKTLEEPPAHVLFILATTHAHKLPDTIKSRSQQFQFRAITARRIAERLQLIAEAEGVAINPAALLELARAGAGSMRDAQSAFDQVISFSEGAITTSEVEVALGIAPAELLHRVMAAVLRRESGAVLEAAGEVYERGHELRNFCRDLMGYVRDLTLSKVTGERPGGEYVELLDGDGSFSESDLIRFFHSLADTESRLQDAFHGRYVLEMGLVKLVEMKRLAPLGTILARMTALEHSLK